MASDDLRPLLILLPTEAVRPACFGDPKGTYLMTIDERRQFVQDMGQRRAAGIPATIEHPPPVPGSRIIPVLPKMIVGRVVDCFMRADGQLLNTVEVFHENDAVIEEIIQVPGTTPCVLKTSRGSLNPNPQCV